MHVIALKVSIKQKAVNYPTFDAEVTLFIFGVHKQRAWKLAVHHIRNTWIDCMKIKNT